MFFKVGKELQVGKRMNHKAFLLPFWSPAPQHRTQNSSSGLTLSPLPGGEAVMALSRFIHLCISSAHHSACHTEVVLHCCQRNE